MSFDQSQVSRRTVAKGAAWSVPAVAVAAAAPSLAASPDDEPNLSTSIQGEGSGRVSANELQIEASTIINSGGVAAEGLVVTFDSSDVVISGFSLGGLDPAVVGIAVDGLGTQFVTMTVPSGTTLGQVYIEPEDSYLSPLTQNLTFENGNETTLTVVATAANGGVPFTPPPTVVPVYEAP